MHGDMFLPILFVFSHRRAACPLAQGRILAPVLAR